jgi:hypothetical protein
MSRVRENIGRRGQRARTGLARLRRAAAAAGWTLTLGGIAYGLWVIRPASEDVISRRGVRLEWVDLPPWLRNPNQAQFVEQRTADAGLLPSDRVNDPDLPRRVAERLGRSPWIARVREVRADASGRMRVSAEFREPLALVERDGVTYVVDGEGVLLHEWKPVGQVDHREWYVLYGVRGPVPAEAGQTWEGGDVRAGLALVRYLLQAEAAGRLPFRALLRAVDVANVGRRVDRKAGELRIRTVPPETVIHWGLAPRTEFSVEARPEEKLARMNALYERKTLTTGGNIDLRDENGEVAVSPAGTRGGGH